MMPKIVTNIVSHSGKIHCIFTGATLTKITVIMKYLLLMDEKRLKCGQYVHVNKIN